jgi:endonuclease/exonuclease/phosphatase family metal-dependent hydrolase
MKLMAYNILGGWEERIELILDIIENESPDVLVLNEANAFIPDIEDHLEVLSSRTGLSYSASAPSGKDTFHVVVLSKTPLTRVVFLAPMARAGMLVIVDSEFGELAIVGTHLTPFTEEERLEEVNLILDAVRRFDNAVIMGDLNALSPQDPYPDFSYESLNEKQRAKFAADEALQFDVVEEILSAGFVDVSAFLGKNDIATAPTAITDDEAHADTRLDYIFVSSALAQYVSEYTVVKDHNAEIASDHYPVTAELKNLSGAEAGGIRRKIIEEEWFDFDWDPEKVWEVDVEPEEMSVGRLEWHLAIPLWEYEGERNRVTPRQVLDAPDEYPDYFQEIMDTDMSCPIDIMWWNNRWMILDGVHRLAKASHLGHDEITVRKIPHSAVPSIQP